MIALFYAKKKTITVTLEIDKERSNQEIFKIKYVLSKFIKNQFKLYRMGDILPQICILLQIKGENNILPETVSNFV